MLNYTKSEDGLTFTVTCKTKFSAIQHEHWLVTMSEPDEANDRRDLTAKNAIQAAYREQIATIQDQIDALETQTNPESGLAEKQAALIAERDKWNQWLRETES